MRRLMAADAVADKGQVAALRDQLEAAVLAADAGAVAEIKALLAGASQRSYPDQDRAEREAQTRRLRDLLGSGE